jgi:hypothetical protein
MNGTLPNCTDKTPIRAALEDTVVVFLASLFASIIALLSVGIDVSQPTVFLGPLLTAGLVGVNTWAKVRQIQLPVPVAEEEIPK